MKERRAGKETKARVYREHRGFHLPCVKKTMTSLRPVRCGGNRLCLTARLRLAFLLLFILCELVGCGNAEKDEGTQEEHRIAVILPQVSDFWLQMWDGVRDAADVGGIALSEYPSSQTDSIAGRFLIADTAGGEGIILFASDDTDQELLDLILAAREKGKKIIIVDTDIGEQYYDEFIGIDNEADAIRLADWLLAHYTVGDKIIVLHGDASGAVWIREQVFLDYVEGTDLAEQIEMFTLGENKEENFQELKSIIKDSGEFCWVVSFIPNSTEKAAETLTRQIGEGDAAVIGFGESDTALEYLRERKIAALLIQDNYSIGRLAVEDMKAMLGGTEPLTKQRYVDSTILDVESLTEEEESSE